MLGILAGSKRYAHIAGVRSDAVAAQALGLKGLVSEDSVRRALKAMKPEATGPWMREALMRSVRDALDLPWVMDIDATVKPLYGHQEGAQIGYNPYKSGRPSHVFVSGPTIGPVHLTFICSDDMGMPLEELLKPRPLRSCPTGPDEVSGSYRQRP